MSTPHRLGTAARSLLLSLSALAISAAMVISHAPFAVAAEADSPSPSPEALPAPARATAGITVLDRQHTDAVSVRYHDNALELKTRADVESGPHQLFEPANVRFHLTDRQHSTVPNAPGYDFVGEAGSEIWLIQERYQPETLWAGWETETVPTGLFEGDTITLELSDIEGPGNVELFASSPTGTERLLSSSEPSLRSMTEFAGAHSHANWAFTAPGDYALTFTASAKLPSGETVESEASTYCFTVSGNAPEGPCPQPEPQGKPKPTPNPGPDPLPEPAVPAENERPAEEPTTAAPTPEPQADAGAGAAARSGQAQEQCIATEVTEAVSADSVSVATEGHFDFGPVFDGGTLQARVKDDRSASGEWIDPARLIFHLGEAAKTRSPGGTFDFLGTGDIWQIPLTQQAQVPWLGWNTQHPTIAGKTQGPVTLTLDSLDGPGDMAVYSMDSWGGLGDRFFGTVSGFPRSTSIAVGASGVHVHGVWAFTEPGTYRAAMSFSTTIGGAEQKANTVLTFFVGDGDPSQAAGEHDVTTVVGQTPDGKPCDLSLAETGSRDRWVIETGAIAVALFALGIAFLGAASLRPRRFVTQQ